jgi:hypothetical protein
VISPDILLAALVAERIASIKARLARGPRRTTRTHSAGDEPAENCDPESRPNISIGQHVLPAGDDSRSISDDAARMLPRDDDEG